MLYENVFYPKNPIIKRFIHSFWVLRSDSSNIPYLLPPDKYFNVILSFKSNTNVIKNDMTKTSVSGSFIVGMRTVRVLLLPDGAVDYLGIEFYPQGLRSFIDFHCINITDLFLEIGSLKNKLHEALKPVINEDLPDEKRVELIERRLLGLIPRITYEPDDYLIKALAVIDENNGLISVGDVCDKFEVSSRRLNREFERFIGVSPKFYSRIVRFNCFLENLKLMEKSGVFTELAYQCGYSDQAHMIHECSAFTGLSPLELLNHFIK